MIDPLEQRKAELLLRMEVDRLRMVIDKTTEYLVELRIALGDAMKLAERNATVVDLAELQEIRRRVL